jgi:hypothetical protein
MANSVQYDRIKQMIALPVITLTFELSLQVAYKTFGIIFQDLNWMDCKLN